MKVSGRKVVAAWFVISGLAALATTAAKFVERQPVVDVRAVGILLGFGLFWRQVGSWAVAVLWSMFSAVLDAAILAVVVFKVEGPLARLLVHGPVSSVDVAAVIGVCVLGALVNLTCAFLLLRGGMRHEFFSRGAAGVSGDSVAADRRPA